MNTIQQAIDSAMTTLKPSHQPAALASDVQVADKITYLSQRGYKPSAQIVEPLRAFLSGYSLLLSGDVGAGKTYLMQCLRVRIYRAGDIAEYGIRNIHTWYEWTDGADICIDDLGTEPMISEFGAKDDILKDVLAHRLDHQRAKRPGKTHITTNLKSAKIAERYGDRTLSRIMGMCKPFVLTGDNLRVAKSHGESTVTGV